MENKKRRTITHIEENLLQLMETKSIDEIKVTDITRLANISRGTFYLYFIDRYDLLEKIENNIMDSLMEILDTSQSIITPPSETENPAIDRTISYIYEHADTIKILLSPNGHPKFYIRIKSFIRKLIKKEQKKQKGAARYIEGIPQDYAEEILIGSILSILEHWIKKEEMETPEEISQLIIRTRFISPFDMLDH
ncbi:TetR/AcrR family transcriptional regulator [Pradoshia sp.]|uniref:TetR/AcrR family transcriptional regulator n=1 Tax=Pradoshia sp. TaxID=2651281 RepID=UPI003EFD70DB